jgi:uncharacterized protein (DUF2147 family)
MALPPAHAAEPIVGHWLTDDRAAIVRIERCGRKLCGWIERVLDPKAPKNDIKNPDPQRRTRPLVGARILSNFIGAGSVWKDGRGYDPKVGKSYRSQLRLLGSGKLKVTGCVSFLCRSRYWTRAG